MESLMEKSDTYNHMNRGDRNDALRNIFNKV